MLRSVTPIRVWLGAAACAVAMAIGIFAGQSSAVAQGGPTEDLRGRMDAYRAAFMAGSAPSGGSAASISATLDPVVWGNSGDFFVPLDYDGDGKADHGVWRPGAEGVAKFIIRKSSDGSELDIVLGKSGDDPSVTGDYDGDGRADPAVYRAGATAGAYSSWLYYSSATSSVVTVTCNATLDCGKNGDFPSPGDYNGDGRYDFVVQRNHGAGCAVDPTQGSYTTPTADFIFAMNGAASSTTVTCVGRATDTIVPGDYDGDLITDIAVLRGVAGALEWLVRQSSTLTFKVVTHGASATDFPTQGDYDGDGKTDAAVWRPNATAGLSAFLVKPSSGGAVIRYPMGQNGDFPLANFNRH
jgi:hypothetical protein